MYVVPATIGLNTGVKINDAYYHAGRHYEQQKENAEASPFDNDGYSTTL